MAPRGRPLVDETMEAVAALIPRRFPAPEADRLAAFARCFFAEAIDEDIAGMSAPDLLGAIASLWRLARVRSRGAAKVRVYNPHLDEHGWHSARTIVEIVNDDMPFLVDSVVAALNGMGLRVRLVIHPILRVGRDRERAVASIAAPGERPADMTLESVLHAAVTRQPDAARLAEIEARLHRVLARVRAAVEDWPAMLAELGEALEDVGRRPPPIAAEDLAEGRDFMEWLRDDRFTFLGYREYAIERRGGALFATIVRDKNLGVLRTVDEESRRRHEAPLPRHVARHLLRPELFIMSKAWTRAEVHRPVHMDYIGVRRFDDGGKVVGERRFLGLLTSNAYSASPWDIPLLRRKVATVVERAGFIPNSHNEKALDHVLHTLPRDELFQLDDDTLEAFALGILHLEHSQKIRLFMRRDGYGEFVSCLVFVPRDRYSTDLRNRMEKLLLASLGGDSVDVTTQVSDAPLARAHFIVRTPSGEVSTIEPGELERRLVAVARLWEDDLADALIDRFGEARGHALFLRYGPGAPAAYKESFAAELAVADIERIEALVPGGIGMNLYRRADASERELDFKIYSADDPIPLSGIVPMLEHMGLIVIKETPFELKRDGGRDSVWVHDILVEPRGGEALDLEALRPRFHDCFSRVWTGEVEDDDFNTLVLAGLAWHQIVILRAYARYMNQANAPFSQRYIQRAVNANPEAARLLVELFEARFDPRGGSDRAARQGAVKARLEQALDAVAVLDQDRILRRYLNLIEATLRTNVYRRGAAGQAHPCVCFKLDPGLIEELPEPRPWRELFVHSNRVEAVHLRGGPVARGGIRWSDRPDDFRTEVLGLMKAQTVKNVVIVPVGAKGGFVLRRPPEPGGREALQAEAVACYRLFVSALLDVTDNLEGGEIVPPPQVVRHDGDDPYLVVAADKGTTTFSDIANEVAAAHGYWLGDAFASGGSAGYDHKAMGITARGAWEAVKRHFRELGRDIQAEAFSVVGIGDMSGDVFGNAVLLSPRIRLLGAFDHRHVFVDPDPPAGSALAERKRLFELPRSSWADYDRRFISEGGGVFDRRAKSIALSPGIRRRFGLARERATPNELIRALLASEVDLLWNGGIGTFVKASGESHAEVGDRANDPVRVDAGELRCRVLGEGGNLGITQRGRIEFALRGGRINTDAIDNAAGVDCSDHEVNIKILLAGAVAAGEMTLDERNALQVEMTDDVASLVLRHNYRQTQALTMLEHWGRERTDEHVRLMLALEQAGLLDRALEGLPDDEEIAGWRGGGRRFTRPELSVLLAYAKMDIYAALLESDLPDDPDLEDDLEHYFPRALRGRFGAAIRRHRLRREMVANFVANLVVDRAGAGFARRLAEEAGAGLVQVVRACLVTLDAFGLREAWRAIESLDNRVPARVQTAMMAETMVLIERATVWFLNHRPQPMALAATADTFRPALAALSKKLAALVSRERAAALESSARAMMDEGVPRRTAQVVAHLRARPALCDVVATALELGRDPIDVATVFFDVGETLGGEWMRDMIQRLPVEERWDRLARQALFEESYAQQRALAARVLVEAGGAPETAVARWTGANDGLVARARRIMADVPPAAQVDLARVSVAGRALGVLVR